MWNSISKLIDPNFKPAPRYKKKFKKRKKKEKLHIIKKENLEIKKNLALGEDQTSSFGRGRSEDHQEMEKKKFWF